MPSPDFRDFTHPLVLTVNGVDYEIPPVDVELGLELLGILQGDQPATAMTMPDLYARLLGSAGERMLADKVPFAAYDRAAIAALADFNAGREIALRVWETGLPPEQLAALVAATEASTRSTSTEAATRAPAPASTSGTTSRRARRPAPKRANRSR